MLFFNSPNPAPNPRRVRIFAAEKGIALDVREVSIIKREQKAPAYLALNARGQTPSLQLDDGTVITESVAICRLSFFSVMTLGILVNWLAGGLLAFSIFFYGGIYTLWLKRWTAQNIVIGGAAGALPPVVAWAAATGSLSMEPLLLFLIIFFWTPPHFWALALFRSDDYARAGVPMLPVVAGPDATRLQILLYTIVLVVIAFAPWPLGYFDAIYGVTSLVLGSGMMALAINVYRRREGKEAVRATRRLFAFSILYLFALFATLLLEVVVRAVAPAIRAVIPVIG